MQDNSLDQIEEFKEFFESVYENDLMNIKKTDKQFLLFDFSELSQFNIELAESLLNEPIETFFNAELAVDQLNVSNQKVRLRVHNIPSTQKTKIRDIRSLHIGSLLVIEGIVRQSSDVRPQVTSAKFECPSCGNLLSVLQLGSAFKEPSRCGCGRKGRFRLVSKELVDAQRIVLEENPEQIDGGAQPKRMNFFL